MATTWTRLLVLMILGVALPLAFARSSEVRTITPVFLKTASQIDLNDRAGLRQLEQQLTAFRSNADPDKRLARGARELERLTTGLLDSPDTTNLTQITTSFRETVAALNNLSRAPLPEKVDFFQTPWFFLKRLSRPVGRGRTPAADLLPASSSDLSRTDPQPSTFWQRPKDLPMQDLYYGFGRTNLLLENDSICTYAAAKESYGRNPGFEVDCNGTRIKVKFAEVSSEPFASRIFFALGFHTDPTDYVLQVKVRYARAMLQEFNSRKPLQTHFTFLGFIPLFTLQLQQRYDPFDYVAGAVLRNGSHWSAAELKQHLFRDVNKPHPEADSANFRPEIESTIDYLEMVPANVQSKDGKSIGPWDFGQLDHSSRRELRGAALLAGWLGWFDTRFDNTRLRIVKRQGEPQLEHFFSDLGGVLGETGGMLYARGELPNAFPWTFTRPAKSANSSSSTTPFPLSGYKPIAPTPAFAAMTLQDARWMGRLIAALTEQQLAQALVASGFDSAQTRLYLEKLINRRNQMIADLGLSEEIPVLRPPKADHRFSYDPAVEGRVTVKLANRQAQAPLGNHWIVNGKLKTRSN